MSYLPCIDAMRYFCQEIFPESKKASKGKALDSRQGTVTRSRSAQKRCRLCHRQVEDVVPYYQQCTVCIVPLRGGVVHG
jgi:hypothetical protein